MTDIPTLPGQEVTQDDVGQLRHSLINGAFLPNRIHRVLLVIDALEAVWKERDELKRKLAEMQEFGL